MSNSLEADARVNSPGGGRSGRVSGTVCPVNAAHQVASVSALYAASRGEIGIALRHGLAGVQGRSSGRAHMETALSAALAPPAPLPSWQRPVAAMVGAVALGVAAVLSTLDGRSEQSAAGAKLFAIAAVTVFVIAGVKALARWRMHQQVSAAHAAAVEAWREAFFCQQCGASRVPGDRQRIGLDRPLGRTLFQRAKAATADQGR